MINVKDSTSKSIFNLCNTNTNINSTSNPISNDNNNIKLRDLYIELDRKDLVIQTLQSQLTLAQSQAKFFQSSSLKKQESINNNTISDQGVQMMLCQKDKTIKELDSLIKLGDNDSHKLKRSIIDKEGEMNTIKQELNETTVKLQNAQLCLKGKENEVQSLKEDVEQRYSIIIKDKKQLESKTNQLIEIIKQYSKEISDYTIQIQSLETEKKSLTSINQSLTNQINDCNNKVFSYERQLAGMIDLTNENNDLNRTINQLRNDISKEKQLNMDMTQRNQKLEDTKSTLINKTETMSLIRDDNEALKRKYDSLSKEYDEMCISLEHYKDCDEKLKVIVPWIGEEMALISEWVSTYMGIYYNYDINPIVSIVSISNDCNSNSTRTMAFIPDEIRRIIDSFKQFLFQKRNSINEEQYNYEDSIKQLKSQMNQLLNQIEDLQYDNKELSHCLLKLKETNEKSKIEIDRYTNCISKLQNDLQISKANQAKERDQHQMILSQLNEIINKDISSILHKDCLVKFYDILCQPTSSSPLSTGAVEPNLQSILEESLNKLLLCLRAIIKDYEIIPLLTKENEVLKKEKEGLIKKIDMIQMDTDLKLSQSEAKHTSDKMLNEQVYKDKVKSSNEEVMKMQVDNENMKRERETALATIQLLEKRLKNIQTELELKEMQIRSQEQIINRRTQQTITVNSNHSNDNSNDKNNNSESIISSLESDKAKLIEDNITLIKDNCILKDSIKELMEELNKTKMVSK